MVSQLRAMLAQILFIMVRSYIPAHSYETCFGKYSYFEDSAFEFVLNASSWCLAYHSSFASISDSQQRAVKHDMN